jgi:hypothetical protein
MLNTKRNEVFNANDVINSNDLRKRIVNIDSRFRTSPLTSTTDFYYKFQTPYKNVIRTRVASVEIPNMAYAFSEKNFKNTWFSIKAKDYSNVERGATIQIRDGNYSAVDLMSEIQTQLNANFLVPYGIFIEIYPDPIQIKTHIVIRGTVRLPPTGAQPAWPPPLSRQNWTYISTNYTIGPSQPFHLDFVIPSLYRRTYNNGLGFNLGYRQTLYDAVSVGDTPNSYEIVSDSCIDVIGDMYYFLSVDDFYTVEQQTNETTFDCLAKIIIREDKGNTIYDDGSTLLSNDVVFPSPIDLKQVRIRLLDPYGVVVDLNDMNFSFSLEITEVMNTKLYEFYRNYIWLGQLPSLPQDVRGSGVPLLGGRGP